MTEEQSALYPVEVRPKPGVIVTPALYKLHVKRARKTAHMKLRWALNSSELFARSFQIKLIHVSVIHVPPTALFRATTSSQKS